MLSAVLRRPASVVGTTAVQCRTSAQELRDRQEQQPMVTTAFEDSESLGAAWHAVGGATATISRPSPTATCMCCFRTTQRSRCGVRVLLPSSSLVRRKRCCVRLPYASMLLGSERDGDVHGSSAGARVVWLSICLQEAHSRAVERIFAPGGAGFVEARQSFHTAVHTS